jgi:hypothetical protein
MLIAAVDKQAKINGCVECSAMSLDKYFLPKLGYLSNKTHAITSLRAGTCNLNVYS